MHTSTPYAAILYAIGASAASLPLVERAFSCPADSCSFTLEANGKPVYHNPTDVHQVAFGGSQPGSAVTFCIDGDGKVTDDGGVCGITQNSGTGGKTSQFQCDATMMSNFTITCDGYLEYNGSPNFYGCLASSSIGYNFYATPPSGEACASGKPIDVKLSASGCHAECAQKSGCPGTLQGDWQYPHLIVPVSKSNPNMAYGTSYNGKVTSDIGTIFNFDVPASYEGMTCTVVFDWPEQSMLQTSSYTASGSGMVDFCSLASPATQSTTYANMPKAMSLGSQMMSPGNSYKVWSGACPAGMAVAYEMSTMSDTMLEYFQDYNPCPIGMYMLATD